MTNFPRILVMENENHESFAFLCQAAKKSCSDYCVAGAETICRAARIQRIFSRIKISEKEFSYQHILDTDTDTSVIEQYRLILSASRYVDRA